MTEPYFTPMAVALGKFVEAIQTQSQEHIKPLHWHIACRLVIEGGFHPDCTFREFLSSSHKVCHAIP